MMSKNVESLLPVMLRNVQTYQCWLWQLGSRALYAARFRGVYKPRRNPLSQLIQTASSLPFNIFSFFSSCVYYHISTLVVSFTHFAISQQSTITTTNASDHFFLLILCILAHLDTGCLLHPLRYQSTVYYYHHQRI